MSPFRFNHTLCIGFLLQIDFCRNVSFDTQFYLSQFEFLHFELCHNLSFVTVWVSYNLKFLTIWVKSQIENCHNMSVATIWVWSQFEFFFKLGLVKVWVLSQFEYWVLSLVIGIKFCVLLLKIWFFFPIWILPQS